MDKSIVIIAGPTASGKTNFSINLAKKLNGEIINADSLQVYKENQILSAQPTLEERQDIPHHLFGYVNGDEDYNIAKWIKDATDQINKLNRQPILVGGTGFYLKHLIFGLSSIPDVPEDIRAETRELFDKIGAFEFYKLLEKLDPDSANILNFNNGSRTMRAYEVMLATGKPIHHWQQKNNKTSFPVNKFKVIILQPPRELLYENCNQRFLNMLEKGALEEVRCLVEKNYNLSTGIMKSHGVPELRKYLLEEWSLSQAISKSQQMVRNYAKRQTTWFKHQFCHAELSLYFLENPSEDLSKGIDFLNLKIN